MSIATHPYHISIYAIAMSEIGGGRRIHRPALCSISISLLGVLGLRIGCNASKPYNHYHQEAVVEWCLKQFHFCMDGDFLIKT